MTRSPITTHVLDTARGMPAQDVPVALEYSTDGKDYARLASSATNADGRVADLLPADHQLAPGIYRLTFDTKTYLSGQRSPVFFPAVSIAFEITTPDSHYHGPLLLSPFGYSTYRGS